MHIILSNITFSMFEMLFIVIIPILLIIAGIIYIALSQKQMNLFQKALHNVINDIKDTEEYSIENTILLKEAVDDSDYPLLSDAINQTIENGNKKYQGKWLPELSERLNTGFLSSKQLKSSLSDTPALLIFSCGFIASLIMIILPYINPNVYSQNLIFSTLPLLVAALISLFLLNHKNVLSKNMNIEIDDLKKSIEQIIPVYSDKAGLSLLVNEMTEHENKIDASLTEFNHQLDEFVSEDFQNSLNDSIREIMEKEIAPPINKASETLSDLATSLAEQQDQGMSELAESFSEKLNISLKNNFASITNELSSFNVLMEDTTNFIHDSIAILENSRQQNILINREVSDSIELMTVAKNDIANEMAKMSDYLEVIANVTEKMTSVYAGEDANLKQQIGSLELALNSSLNTINESIYQSQSTMSLSSQLKEEQQAQYSDMIEKMNSLLVNLNTVNQSIHDTTDNFAIESGKLVKTSLNNYEKALSDIVERLIYTTAEIKDAVEALPLAINAKSDYFEKK